MDAIEVQYPMNGGHGPYSYVQNSSYQKGVVDAARDVIFQVVAEKLDLGNPCFDSSNPFRIADLGCSTGPNTFFAMQNVVEAVKLKYQSIPQTSPEFLVFFNDHTDNDFNVLFRSLPHNTGASPGYFAAGVPGSLLFPKNTFHFLHSSYALQWLSKVPKEVLDRDSPAWNKGKIHYTGSDEHVTKAFFGQFQKDMDGFLKARAQEMVGGGLMLIQLPGIRNGGLFSQTGAGMIHFILGSCLVEMAKMGYTTEEKVDTFNVPQYHPLIEDLEMVVDMNKCFTIEKAGVLFTLRTESFLYFHFLDTIHFLSFSLFRSFPYSVFSLFVSFWHNLNFYAWSWFLTSRAFILSDFHEIRIFTFARKYSGCSRCS
ncbi:loganic acid O-methyltransferase-like [Cornus florida]|uniref:loganic acid O-methyltransferase-like n=1 Tax=Cornus florida TaxID=4283 RepID=UPI0028963777|nr:loganic acid O-methyltransferase-like [Cornus florida]